MPKDLNITERLTSRKLWVAVLTMIAIVAGDMPMEEIVSMVAIAIAYVLGESAIDARRAGPRFREIMSTAAQIETTLKTATGPVRDSADTVPVQREEHDEQQEGEPASGEGNGYTQSDK